MTDLFVDTAALFAALVRTDARHGQAAAVLERLLTDGVELHCSNYVLIETFALLQSRIGLEAVRRVQRELRPLLRMAWIGEDLHERAYQRWELRGRRGVSLVDCSSFAVMEERDLRHVFTYDRDFAEEGFVVIERPDQLTASAGE